MNWCYANKITQSQMCFTQTLHLMYFIRASVIFWYLNILNLKWRPQHLVPNFKATFLYYCQLDKKYIGKLKVLVLQRTWNIENGSWTLVNALLELQEQGPPCVLWLKKLQQLKNLQKRKSIQQVEEKHTVHLQFVPVMF